MNNLSNRNLVCDRDFYRDAATLGAEEWITHYAIHPTFIPLIHHYKVASDGTHPFVVNDALTPFLKQAAIRVFMLGMQIASEEKGNGGRCPVLGVYLDCEEFKLPNGDVSPVQCGTIAETNVVWLSHTLIENTLTFPGGFFYTGHMPNRLFDPLQTFLILGIEEGLHAESFRIPENVESFIADSTNRNSEAHPGYDEYLMIAAERFIHDDLIAIADKINPTYDQSEWELFMRTYKADRLTPHEKRSTGPEVQ